MERCDRPWGIWLSFSRGRRMRVRFWVRGAKDKVVSEPVLAEPCPRVFGFRALAVL